MKINCPWCGQKYDIEESMIGVDAQCQACGKDFFIDDADVYDREEVIQKESPREEPSENVAQSKEIVSSASSSGQSSYVEETKTTFKPLTCEMCGSTNILRQDGVFVCQACGTKYSVEEAKKMMVSGTVNVAGTVKVDISEKLSNLYKIARRAKEENNDENAAKYYDLILQEDPNSWEASFYSVYYKAMGCKIAEIWSAASSVANCLKSVFPLINEYVKSPEEREHAIVEVFNSSFTIANMLSNAATNHFYDIDSQVRDQFQKDYDNNMANTIMIWVNLGDQLERFASWDKDKAQDILKYATEAWKMAITITNQTFDEMDQAMMEDNFFSVAKYTEKIKKIAPDYQAPAVKSSGCYIATAVYGSYDCPQVWTLRRYRDYILASTWFGRCFIRIYYAISPTLVGWFGNNRLFINSWKRVLNRKIKLLNDQGVSNLPYHDKKW
jgi:uncharacterized protein (DUF983 family)